MSNLRQNEEKALKCREILCKENSIYRINVNKEVKEEAPFENLSKQISNILNNYFYIFIYFTYC